MEEHNLVDGYNCTAQSIQDFPDDLFTNEQRLHGAVLLHVVFDLYLFYALAIVCDEYFIPAVERIAEEFNMPSDIAGATVMGIANSSPELFTNVVGTFITKGDMGIGTVVGSSVFNILFVGAAIGIFTRQVVPVSWWSISRDSFFYLLSIGMVAQTMMDQRVQLHDAIVLLALYVLYIVVIYFNKPLKNCAKRVIKAGQYRQKYNIARLTISVIIPHVGIVQNQSPKAIEAPAAPSVVSDCTLEYDDAEKVPTPEKEEESMNRMGLFKLPSSEATLAMCVDFVIGWPFRFLLKFTIPDCKTKAWRKWYFVTFFMCVVWNTGLCYLVSWMTTVIGFTIGIPDTLMGLTVIAAGTSVPQVVGSVIVARKGLGTMAMNNAIGSNIFNVLICMGMPWLIRIIMDNHPIPVQSNSLIYSILMLIISMVVLYTMLAFNGFNFDKKIGIVLFFAYLIFIVVGSLFEMNVFLNVNLPACPLEVFH